MNCITEETAMMFAEDELAPAEAQGVETHLKECRTCRELIGVLRDENAAIAAVFHDKPANRPLRALVHLAGSIAASLTVAVPAQWSLTRLSEAGTWVNYIAGIPFEIAFRVLRTFALLLLLVAITQIASPAMTTRNATGGALVIASQETINDSVLATGDTVLVEGKIEGNLYIFGRSLEIRGQVDGDVIAGGQEVRITGNVTGNVLAGAESVSVSGHVGGNLYAGARNIHVEKGGRVDLEVLSGSDTVTVDGTIGRSLIAGATTAVIAGVVSRGVGFAGNKVLVRSEGKIGGDIVAEVADRSNVQVDPGASVAGKIDVTVRKPANTWAQPGTYIWEVAVLAGAFLVGWLLSAVFPRFFAATIRQVPSWVSVGVGFAALIVIPIGACVLLITVIGIPLAVGAVFLYVAGLYLAKILVGAYLGRELMGAKNETGLPTLVGLLAGLVILQVLFLVPYAGGILRLAVCCLGLGALALQLRRPVH